MALYTRNEWIALCNLTSAAIITVNIKRGKITLTEDKKIDSENALNKKFFDNYLKKNKEKAKKIRAFEESGKLADELYNKVVEKVEIETSLTDKKLADKKRKKENKKAQEVVDWDLRKKKAEALLKERTAEKALLSLKKMYGEMVPTEFVKRMFVIYTKSILSTFDNATMNLAGVFCDELAGGDREALTRVNQKLNEEFDLIIEECSEIARKDLENEIKQYSVKKSKGEKE